MLAQVSRHKGKSQGGVSEACAGICPRDTTALKWDKLYFKAFQYPHSHLRNLCPQLRFEEEQHKYGIQVNHRIKKKEHHEEFHFYRSRLT